MIRHHRFLQIALTAVVGAFLFASTVSADGKSHRSGKGRVYRVAITNLTKAQIFSPAVLATHNDKIRVFTVGETASAGVVDVAENGMNALLADELDDLPNVHVVAADAMIFPGETAYYEIHARGRADRLSIVGMLVSTNDAFYGVNGLKLPSKHHSSMSFWAVAYDAGSEENDEECDSLPGPCGGPPNGVNNAVNAGEGYIHVHNGVHGMGMDADLDAKTYDWRNPVARVKVKRIH